MAQGAQLILEDSEWEHRDVYKKGFSIIDFPSIHGK